MDTDKSVPIEGFWEKDDGESMDGIIRIERFIKSRGTDAAQIWWAWYDIKQKLKALSSRGAGEAVDLRITQLRERIRKRWDTVDIRFVGLKTRDLAMTFAIDEMINHLEECRLLAPAPAPVVDGPKCHRGRKIACKDCDDETCPCYHKPAPVVDGPCDHTDAKQVARVNGVDMYLCKCGYTGPKPPAPVVDGPSLGCADKRYTADEIREAGRRGEVNHIDVDHVIEVLEGLLGKPAAPDAQGGGKG